MYMFICSYIYIYIYIYAAKALIVTGVLASVIGLYATISEEMES